MRSGVKPPNIPAAFFGIVLGLAGLGNTWRAAHLAWGLPAAVGEVLIAAALLVWLVLAVLYGLKWAFMADQAIAESRHPVQCCFIGLGGVATMLVALGLLPYIRPLALAIFALGGVFTLAFAIWRTGLLWQGDREASATTPVLYLPTVAAGFVTATVASALGYLDWAQLAFGAALFSWLAIESVLLHRLYTEPSLPAMLRPTLGIQLAPPTVGAVAYLSVNGGVPDLGAHALLGYGILQALLLLRLSRWIMQQPFAASYWAFTFGATALPTAALRLVAHGDTGAVALLAPILFVGANLLVVLVAIGTVRLIAQKRLLPVAAPAKATP